MAPNGLTNLSSPSAPAPIGLALAMTGTRFMKTMLDGVDASGPATFTGGPALLCVVAVPACRVLARRALASILSRCYAKSSAK